VPTKTMVAGTSPEPHARDLEQIFMPHQNCPVPGHSVSRDGRIRTGDPLLPKQVRYQAAPRPVGASLVVGSPAPKWGMAESPSLVQGRVDGLAGSTADSE
jgi:hypothetical protein